MSSAAPSELERSAFVNEILQKLRLKRQDLNNLSSSQIRKIFEDLSVKEISLLCRTNKKFNKICEDPSFWKNKVLNDYGVKKKYGDTWRETAKNMSKTDMINLNDKWVNGHTYEKILNDATEMKGDDGWEYIRDMYSDTLDEVIGEDFRMEFYEDGDLYYQSYDDNLLEIFNVVGFSVEQIEKLAIVHGREINIIIATIASANKWDKALPSISFDEGLHDKSIMEIFPLFYIIDPIFYVMQFSAYPDDKVFTTIWDFLENY